ncbi:carbonic anhydrase [Sporomusa acidovorans]|uniref:Carbonic anhydrase n=1 Tax=Sporomusa acidovorans (strain ATCC 49682 / DSM 3132 / Mol) TaxID=1123286 RepID=A0ABZ3J091_SPOA4|nr:carbonic anhydrase [Sporomusa acidovorans]OZC22895.1 carbonic anhydrase [Sporomusa acidovorans DSM 3132]SDF74156.1 carbonic anhydrase [Sporomusa acidovorans]
MDAYQALEQLIAGNRRYVSEKYAKADIGIKKRSELAQGQEPFAIILGCSDSRIPPEIVFDQGLGQLFVVRTAGQVVDAVVLGSIEYAVEHLDVRLIVVMGHQDCGAVKAALESSQGPWHIDSLIQSITPAVETAKNCAGELLPNAIKANIEQTVEKLQSASPLLKKAITTKGLQIVGAVQNISKGSVTLLI